MSSVNIWGPIRVVLKYQMETAPEILFKLFSGPTLRISNSLD